MNRRPLLPLLAALFLFGCVSDDPGPKCIVDCQLCSDSQCPPDRCGIKVVLSPKCEGRGAELAEVAVDQCVEPSSLQPGTSQRLCATVKANQTANVVVRADEWTWPRQVYCSPDKAGGFIILTLYCEEPGGSVPTDDIIE